MTVHLPDNRQLDLMVKTGSSYCSQSELPVTFGLGKLEGSVTLVSPGMSHEVAAERLATAIKLFPGFLFLYFLLQRQWRTAAVGIERYILAQ